MWWPAGLTLSAGGFALLDPDGTPRCQPGTPSVTAFSFATSEPESPPAPPEVVPPPAEEPTDPAGAVVAFLQPLAEGRPDAAYPLLDEASRGRYPTLA